jgi:hypothetical protein
MKPGRGKSIVIGLGPRFPARTAPDWRRMVLAGTWAGKLAALVWLGGIHQSREDRALYLEIEKQVEIYVQVATDPKVRGAVADLRADPDPWIAEAAVAAGETLRSVRP